MVMEREEVDYGVFIHCTPLFDDIEWDPKLQALQGCSPAPNFNPIAVLPPLYALEPYPIQDDLPPNGSGAVFEITDLSLVGVENQQEAQPMVVAEAEVVGIQMALPEVNPRQGRRRGRPRKIPVVATSMSASSSRRPRGRPPKDRSRPKPKAVRRVVRRRINKDDFQLPPGWFENRKVRKSGVTVGHADMYYIEIKSGRKCRSRIEVTEYLAAQRRKKKKAAKKD